MSSGGTPTESGSERSSPSGSTAAQSTTEPPHADATIISTTPPHEMGAATAMLDPRQLGQALEGQQLDHVLLEKFVGGGGMGAVFRAWDTNLHRTAAVKGLSQPDGGVRGSERLVFGQVCPLLPPRPIGSFPNPES